MLAQEPRWALFMVVAVACVAAVGCRPRLLGCTYNIRFGVGTRLSAGPWGHGAAEFVEWRSNSPARYLRDEHGRAFSVRKIVGVAQSSRRVASDELRNRRFFRTRAKQCPGSLFAVMLLL